MSLHKEIEFENDICDHLAAHDRVLRNLARNEVRQQQCRLTVNPLRPTPRPVTLMPPPPRELAEIDTELKGVTFGRVEMIGELSP